MLRGERAVRNVLQHLGILGSTSLNLRNDTGEVIRLPVLSSTAGSRPDRIPARVRTCFVQVNVGTRLMAAVRACSAVAASCCCLSAWMEWLFEHLQWNQRDLLYVVELCLRLRHAATLFVADTVESNLDRVHPVRKMARLAGAMQRSTHELVLDSHGLRGSLD